MSEVIATRCSEAHPRTNEQCVFGAGHPIGYHYAAVGGAWLSVPDCRGVCRAESCTGSMFCSYEESYGRSRA